jgi:hypothetical protein
MTEDPRPAEATTPAETTAPQPVPATPAAASVVARYAAPIGVGIVALLLYVRTMLPGVAFDDWGEMQTVPHVLGIAHPTGYPTYILVAWLFELLPIGEVAFRANLLSGVCVALALAFATSAQQRLGVSPLIAAVASLAAGLVGTIWVSAVVAEVNPLHLLLMALLIDRSLAWADSRRLRDLALGGLIIGLSLGNHALTIFVAPYLILYVLWAGRATLLEHKRWILAPVLTVFAGAAVYVYIPIAASLRPPLLYNNPVTWDAFKFLVTGEQFRGQYGGLFTTEGPAVFLASPPNLWTLLVENGSAGLPILGALGAVALFFRRPAFAAALGAILLTGLYVWANYLELPHYLIVPWLVIGILAGVALDTGARLAARLLPERWRTVPTVAAAGLGVVLVAVLVASNFAAVDKSGDRTTDDFVDLMLDSLSPDAAIVTYWGASAPLWHATMVQDRRTDILIVDDSNIAYEGWGNRETRIATLICERPVFILRQTEKELVQLRQVYDLTPVARPIVSWGGPTGTTPITLYRVSPRAGTCP